MTKLPAHFVIGAYLFFRQVTTAYTRRIFYLDPEYVPQFAALASLGAPRARINANGFIGSLEYGAITDYGEEWHEISCSPALPRCSMATI